jgi:hypothetical protein
MTRLASWVLFLFVVNFVFAAVGPHCANGLFGSQAHAAALPDAAHDHADQDHHQPAPDQDQGEICASMQLSAALGGAAMPSPTQVETNFIWAVTAAFVWAVDRLPVESTASPPPPLIASDFDAVHARTGRLLI